MDRQTLPILLLAIVAAPGVLGHFERAACAGASQAGYCCNGSIFQSGDSNDFSASNFVCCEGDPNLGVKAGPNAPKSCTAGTQVPLTEASGNGGGSQATTSSDASTTSASSAGAEASSANDAKITAAPLMGLAAVIGSVVLGL